MVSINRTNPFRSQDRTNFPPLDEFFDESATIRGGFPAATPGAGEDGNTSTISLNQSLNNSPDLNFSVDMSIGGKAEMAMHRYQVQKYGIDGIRTQQSHQQKHHGDGHSPDGSPDGSANISRLSEADDWDRVMDETNISTVSFSSTAIAAATTRLNGHKKNKVGYQTPSPDESSDEGSTSFFDKSMIKSLITPEKIRYKLDGDEKEQGRGVTLSRGQVLDDSYLSESSQEQSTNVSSTPGNGSFERMFHAALRFNKDFEEQSENSFSADAAAENAAVDKSSSSCTKDDSKDKSGCSSISFADSEHDDRNQKHQERVDISARLQGLNFLNTSVGASPIQLQVNQNKDVSSCSIALRRLDLLSASQIYKQKELKSSEGNTLKNHHRHQSSPPSFNCAEKSSEVSCLASPFCSTPRVSPREVVGTLQRSGYQAHAKSSPSELQLIGLSPIDSHHAANKVVKSPIAANAAASSSTPVPFDEKHHHWCTKRNLFQGKSYHHSPPSCTSDLGLKKSLDQCCTHTTVKSEESYFDLNEDATTSPPQTTINLSEEVSPFSYGRTFGSNAAFRVNANVTHKGNTSNRRGVRLSRLSKLKELGLGHVLSQHRASSMRVDYEDTSF